jgi:hypothetical protein
MTFFSFVLLVIFSHAAKAAARSSFQKISSSSELEYSQLQLLLLIACCIISDFAL